MATVVFQIKDGADGQSVECEARSSDVHDDVSVANAIAGYLADNWVGLVQAARLAKSAATIRDAKSLEREREIQGTTGLLDESGNAFKGFKQ